MNWDEEVGGSRSLPASYDQARLIECPTCHADVGFVCTGTLVTNRATKETVKFERRHMPCIARIKATKAVSA